MLQEILSGLDGLAGLAALVNSALLWPTVRALKRLGESHGRRIRALEGAPLDKRSRRSHRGRTRPGGRGRKGTR